jgi:predicted lipid-binding transport protein (Tim44 family)
MRGYRSPYYALAMTEPAPVVPAPQRNRLGIAALVLVLITIALPIVGFIAAFIGALIEGAEGGNVGYAAIGAFFITAAASSLIAPLAILGVVLGIISLFFRGKRKVQGALAIVFGVVPSLFILGLPVAIDTFF